MMVFLDSNHTHQHVLAELEAYAPLVSKESYCIVWDTGVEDLPDGFVTDRPWGKGNNPKTAVLEYLERLNDEGRKARDGAPLHFAVDELDGTQISNNCGITWIPGARNGERVPEKSGGDLPTKMRLSFDKLPTKASSLAAH